ncbi:MAG: hypothetical protein FJY82_11725 [Candidatus Aminicenantes bacterium]|nr:hypothetical protein [Candidatus Aminicenantes bacterium]
MTPELEIERAVNFGGFPYLAEVQAKYGMDKFREVLMKNRNLSRRAVNYWCLVLGIDRAETAVFKNRRPSVWVPFK